MRDCGLLWRFLRRRTCDSFLVVLMFVSASLFFFHFFWNQDSRERHFNKLRSWLIILTVYLNRLSQFHLRVLPSPSSPGIEAESPLLLPPFPNQLMILEELPPISLAELLSKETLLPLGSSSKSEDTDTNPDILLPLFFILYISFRIFFWIGSYTLFGCEDDK